MDTYQIRKTPVEGLWEIAILDQRPLTNYMIGDGQPSLYGRRAYGIPDKRIQNLLTFLQVKYRNRSYRNPNADFYHIDGIKSTRWMLICIATDNKELGTKFPRGSLKEFSSKPWRVYLVRAITRHKSPSLNICNIPRYLFRFDISEHDSNYLEVVVNNL